jgi:site-specific DNA recombinase
MSHHFSRKGDRVYSYYVCSTALRSGSKECPGSRLPTKELEDYVVERIREVGKDPSLLAETIEAAKKNLEVRAPELVAEMRRLDAETRKLTGERKNLLDAVAHGGAGVGSLMTRLGEVDEALAAAGNRAEEVRGELAELNSRVIDENDLRAALEAFDPVWTELFPKEKARILHLLLEKVEYHAADGRVGIEFRAGGVRAMCGEAEGGATGGSRLNRTARLPYAGRDVDAEKAALMPISGSSSLPEMA